MELHPFAHLLIGFQQRSHKLLDFVGNFHAPSYILRFWVSNNG